MIKNFSILELLNIRSWLSMHTNSVAISTQYAHEANNLIIEVDKELWSRVISNNTPWGVVEKDLTEFKDDEFEKTLQSVRDGSINNFSKDS